MQSSETGHRDAHGGHSPLVSVIVVARDEEENIGRCLAGVVSQQTDFDFEVLVVDSGSKDRTVEVAASYGARVMEIPAGSFQHGRTRQMASLEAEGELLVYIVADAVPADDVWLAALVRPLRDDPEVAGAFSRQIPREGAGSLEALRIEHRVSYGEKRKVRQITPEMDFWSMPPEERLRFCEFDDVSCCRRKSVLFDHPIPPVDWAEDLLWSLAVLPAGHKIVYEPGSVVRHSHKDTIAHAFRRGYLDQAVVRESFGVLYFDTVADLLRGFAHIYIEQTKAVLQREQKVGRAFAVSAWNLLRLLAETLGNFLASRDSRQRHTALNLAPRLFKRNILRRRHKGQVLLTRFSLGPDNRRVLFMNPDAASAIKVRVPKDGLLEFAAGTNPAARPLRKTPILFIVAVDGGPVWWRELPMDAKDRPFWEEGRVPLTKWGGKKVTVAFITRSANTDYGWAGWAEPVITTSGPGAADRIVNRFLDAVHKRVKGAPLRHP